MLITRIEVEVHASMVAVSADSAVRDLRLRHFHGELCPAVFAAKGVEAEMVRVAGFANVGRAANAARLSFTLGVHEARLRHLSPRSPCPLSTFVLAFVRRSAASDGPS